MRTLTALVLVVLYAGCFTPNIVDGGLLCTNDGRCPSGFSCYSGTCLSRAPITPTVDGGMPSDGSGGGESRPAVIRTIGQPCDATGVGTVNRTSNCAIGLVCADGNSGAYCFQRCLTASDCGGMACESRQVDTTLGTTATVCARPPVNCDPVAQSGCPGGMICYLSGDRTLCETSSGEGAGTSCLYSRDCLPGFTCGASGPGAGRCFPACRAASSICPTGASCHATGDFGYCL